MGDGSEPLNVFEPLDYLYVTDSVRKVFDISLVAINGCGRDSLMQPLTVLAQSIRAFSTVRRMIFVWENKFVLQLYERYGTGDYSQILGFRG